MRYRWLVVGLLVSAGSCGDETEPTGTLTIVPDPVAATTTAATIDITGKVTRSPAKAVTIIVLASGGAAPAADTVTGEQFSITVPLTLNATNAISLTASDPTGALATAVVVTVRRDPAVLALTPVAAAPLTNGAQITLTGAVTRTPAGTAQIIVEASGGVLTRADTVTSGQYSIVVALNLNQINTIKVLARDGIGSKRDSVNVTVRQDGTAPNIVLATPADTADNVAIATPISIMLNEPVTVTTDGGLVITRQGFAVPGTTALSADSLTLAFTPAVSLSRNAIYRVGFDGVSDRAGNAMASGASSCFVTTPAGSPSLFTATDAVNDVYSSTPPPATGKPDLIAARIAREGETLSGVFRFVGPRSFLKDGTDPAAVFVDLDTDQDSTTGFVTQKDTLFLNSGPPLDTLGSGTRAEYIIGLSPVPELGDNAYVGKYTAPLQFQIVATFIAGSCGAFMSFAIPFSLVDDDGLMRAVVLGYAGVGNAIYVDPMPTKGFLDLSLPLSGPPMAQPPLVTPVHLDRRFRLPRSGAPEPRLLFPSN